MLLPNAITETRLSPRAPQRARINASDLRDVFHRRVVRAFSRAVLDY
jgi:hypothetical protein